MDHMNAPSTETARLLRDIDIFLVLFAAPGLLLGGVPVVGYGVGAVTWLAWRAVGIAMDRHTNGIVEVSQQVALRLVYRLARVFLLAMAVVVARKTGDKHDGLTALLVITFAFTVHLALSIFDRPAPRGRGGLPSAHNQTGAGTC